jgi:DNA primase
MPDGETNTSVQIKINDNLTTHIYSRSDYEDGSIIDLVSYIKKASLSKTVKWLCHELNIDYTYTPTEECETFKYLKKFKKKDIPPIQHTILNESILNKFKNISIKQWLDEGINNETQKKYEVKFDENANRIVFPIRDEERNLISVKGRTCLPNYKDLGVRKYTHYYPIGENDILYGLYLNLPSIKEKNEVIVFEAEKSCMKCDSLGIYNTVAVGTHRMHPVQRRKLIQLQSDIVIAFDKDVQYKEIMAEILEMKYYCNVSYIWDKNNLLGEKDAPIDKGKEIFMELYESRVRV